MTLPTDPAARKALPIFSAVYEYFPDAIAEVARRYREGEPPVATLDDAIAALVREDYGAAALFAMSEIDRCAPLSKAPFAVGFGRALAEVARVSMLGAKQHNGGVLGWVRDKSTDHADCYVRHMLDYYGGPSTDTDGGLHAAKGAWRALALLQLHLERSAPASALAEDPARFFVDGDGDEWEFVELKAGWVAVDRGGSFGAMAYNTDENGPPAQALREYVRAQEAARALGTSPRTCDACDGEGMEGEDCTECSACKGAGVLP